MRLPIKNLFATTASKFASSWSSDYEVVRTLGVNVLVRNARSGEESWVHHDRFFNPFVFRNVNVQSGDEANDLDRVESVPSKHYPDGDEVLNPSALNTDDDNPTIVLNSFAVPSSTFIAALPCVPTVLSSIRFAVSTRINYVHATINCSLLNNTTI